MTSPQAGGADHAGADGIVALVECADVARIFIVVDYFIAVCHDVVSLMFFDGLSGLFAGFQTT